MLDNFKHSLLALIFIVFSSCEERNTNKKKSELNSTKTYYYVEIQEEESLMNESITKTIEKSPIELKALDDTAALIQAFSQYCISKGVNNMLKAKGGRVFSTPVEFKLKNESGDEILLQLDVATKDSIEQRISNSMNATTEDNSSLILDTINYSLLKHEALNLVDNYHILIKYKYRVSDSEKLNLFAQQFRDENCKSNCNIYLYDSKIIVDLIGKYPLDDSEYLIFADHLVAMSTFDSPTPIWEYPFQDKKYERLGGKNWKKKTK